MSKSVKKIVKVAAPIVGFAVGGPIGAAIGGAVGGAVGGGGIKGAALGAITGYAGASLAGAGGGSLFGNAAGTPLSTVAGNAALQGPTAGSGILGAVTGGGVRALAAPVTQAATGATIGGIPQSLLLNAASGVIGDYNEEAALEAARQQAQGIQSGVKANTAALRPYTELGQQATSRINEIQSDPAGYIKGNELYGSLAADAERRLLANQAAKGKVGSGGTAAALQEQLLNIGTGLVNTEIGNLQQQAGLGGNAAAQVGSTQYSGNVATGNANAAGTIGANNALTSTYQNQINTILASQGVNKAPIYSQPINL